MRRVGQLVAIVGGAALAAYLVFPYFAPRLLGWIYRDVIFRFPTNERILYVTIDDAPSSATSEILSVLSKHQVSATFFVIGSWVHDQRQLDQIREAGATLGHHMWTTKACSKLTLEEFRSDFDSTARMLSSSEVFYFRPPSGSGTHEQMAYVKSHGLFPILGTVFPLDSSIQRQGVLQFLVKWLSVPGGILIMHDGNRRGHMTAKVLDAVIPELKGRGWQFRALPSIRPNQALEPTALAVMPRASARVAPAKAVAHL